MQGLSVRAAEVIQVFRDLRLHFGDGSLELLANDAASVDATTMDIAGRSFRVVQHLSVLGVALDAVADTTTMLTHRARAAEAAWLRHRAALTDPGVPPSARWRQWHATVGLSATWGAGCWRPSA